MLRTLIAALALAVSPALAAAQQSAPPDTSLHVTYSGFVDGYFAYDFDRPPRLDRAFTTQPARHDEFNINLAFVDATLSSPRLRGRLALQFGTSVQANYAGEPRVGAVSGPDVSRYLQEAYVGYRIAKPLWLDGGIFFSHIGNEGWISRDQWTYTRSLIADFTPYYEAGVRATWTASPSVTATAVVVNGWQNISETNSSKAAGIRLDWTVSPAVTITYDDFIGNEQPDSAPSRLRLFHEGTVKLTPSARAGLVLSFDVGTQSRGTAPGHSTWLGGALVGRYALTPVLTVNGRVEYYRDPDQVIVASPSSDGFRASGASVGVDVAPAPRVLWRTELRGLRSTSAVFPTRTGSGLRRGDGVVVTSLALTL